MDDKMVNQKCLFTDLDSCRRQDLSRTLDLQLCQVCVSARTEKHIFEIKKMLKQLSMTLDTRLPYQFDNRVPVALHKTDPVPQADKE